MVTVGQIMHWADGVAPMAYYRIALRTADQFRKKGVTAYLVKTTKLDQDLLQILDKEFITLYNTPLPKALNPNS